MDRRTFLALTAAAIALSAPATAQTIMTTTAVAEAAAAFLDAPTPAGQ